MRAIHPYLINHQFTVCVFLTITSLTGAFAADYYVSPQGKDSNPGTGTHPWLTIAKAADTLKAGDTAKRFAQPEGHSVEYEKCPWLTPDTLWGTIPWGTAFHGNDMGSMYQLLCKEFDPEQQHRWRTALKNTGRWI
jgi:hypothetical protein